MHWQSQWHTVSVFIGNATQPMPPTETGYVACIPVQGAKGIIENNQKFLHETLHEGPLRRINHRTQAEKHIPMKLPTLFLTIGFIAFPAAAMSQEDVWELQNSGVATSLRGLCAVSETCCWASGAEGTVIRTTNGGKSWRTVGPPDAEAADFRDLQAWNELTAVIMSAGDVDRLYRTEDGGISWTLVYEHPEPGAFFDGMSFDPTGIR